MARVDNGNDTIEDIRRRMGVSFRMAKDVENIFKHNPDMSEDYFLNCVIGEGDEGYDPECAAVMWNYYEFLQDPTK